MKHFFIFPLLFFSHMLFAQEIYPLTGDFSWKKIEKRNPEVIESFLKLVPIEDFEYYKEPEELVELLHTLDLNNDKLDDVIFYGQTSDDESIVMIYINKGTSFKKEFAKEQSVLHMEFANGVLSKIAIEDLGSGGEVVARDQFFEANLKSSSGDFTFKLIKSFEYIQETELPKTYWATSKRVKVKHDKYKVRMAPVIDDSTSHGDDAGVGNTIGLIPQDGEALAMAESTDNTGRVWYFVAVYPEYPLTSTLFYEPKEGTRSFKCGWISSRFIEVLKD
ncbi:MAG TPA: hypothetical protein VK750_08205 [Cytophagaceae bacterium]|jgi:hypothetical protein|nr:hypothetical protein [Cytophagaceae bacterium]